MSDIINNTFVMSLGTSWPLIPIEKLKEVYEKHEDELPDYCFLKELIENLEESDDDVNPCAKCSTANDDDAKYCKQCGAKLEEEEETTYVQNLDWHGDGAVETFESIFIKKIVPLITGTIEGGFLFGDPEDQNTPWLSAFFVIENGTLRFVAPDMERSEEAPVFNLGEDEE
jgi:hypothetical protein